jgi:hypothetical protein
VPPFSPSIERYELLADGTAIDVGVECRVGYGIPRNGVLFEELPSRQLLLRVKS